MGRLPFDPDRMKKPAKPRAQDEPITVSALASLIEHTLAEKFPARLTVRGEISGTRQRTHWYFNLKDENAVIAAVMFASAAKKSETTPRDGRLVVASGRLEYYKPQGRLSLIVDRLSETGAGALDAKFRELCDQLRAMGWFDPAARRPLPVFPSRIAVLTSDSSAALQDVLDTTRRRCPAVELLLVDIPVQGERAAATIARAIRRIDAHAGALGIDAILLTRGGGSVEDLWCFNDRDLASAIHSCSLPVVAAIGHESDTTIAELVADQRAATPTQAAMLLTPDRGALSRQLDALDRRRRHVLASRLQSEKRHLRSLSDRPVIADPARIAQIQADRLDASARRLAAAQVAGFNRRRHELARLELTLERHRPAAEHARRAERLHAAGERLKRSIDRALNRRRDTLDRLDKLRNAVGPQAVLSRGFTVTTTTDGTLIRSASAASPGDRITTRFSDGSIDSTVIAENASPGEQTRASPSPRPTLRPDGPPQMDLFKPPG